MASVRLARREGTSFILKGAATEIGYIGILLPESLFTVCLGIELDRGNVRGRNYKTINDNRAAMNIASRRREQFIGSPEWWRDECVRI